ncbi:hypothetical protein HD554DRAFT_263032 [Boletus coccyginus]|nr:hypothetical protein HD554DRAFT_263032 [Boletus coccyginus]
MYVLMFSSASSIYFVMIIGLLHSTTLPRGTRLPAQFDPNHNDYHCPSKSCQYQYTHPRVQAGYGIMVSTGTRNSLHSSPAVRLSVYYTARPCRGTRLPAQFDPNRNDYHCPSKSRQYQYALPRFQAGYWYNGQNGNSKFPSQQPRSSTPGA